MAFSDRFGSEQIAILCSQMCFSLNNLRALSSGEAAENSRGRSHWASLCAMASRKVLKVLEEGYQTIPGCATSLAWEARPGRSIAEMAGWTEGVDLKCASTFNQGPYGTACKDMPTGL
jgi:hypothetical protein